MGTDTMHETPAFRFCHSQRFPGEVSPNGLNIPTSRVYR